MDAVSHDTDVYKVREGCHERVHARVAPALIQDSGAHVGPSLRVEGGYKAECLINDFILHNLTSPKRGS